MKLYEIVFWSGETKIEFAESRWKLRQKWTGYGITAINRITIH